MIAVAALTLIYAFPAGSKQIYDMQVTMDGYVPLLGRPQSNVEVKLAFEVAGTGNNADGQQTATYDLIDMKASMSGVALPFTVDNVKAFFPKAAVTISPTGKVLKSDVPDLQLPVRLPGLDPKRIPEISFLPIELSEESVETGKSWTFKRTFSGSEATYTVTPAKIDESEASFDVRLVQSTSLLEDAAGNEVKTQTEAVNKVETTFSGTGKVVFDVKRKLAKSFTADSEAVSQVTEIKTGTKSERRVKSKLKSELRAAGIKLRPLSKPTERVLFGWTLPDAISRFIDRGQATAYLFLRSLGFVR